MKILNSIANETGNKIRVSCQNGGYNRKKNLVDFYRIFIHNNRLSKNIPQVAENPHSAINVVTDNKKSPELQFFFSLKMVILCRAKKYKSKIL